MNIQIKSIYSLFTLIMIAGFLPAQQGYAEPMETIKSFITDKGIDKSDKNWRVKLPKFPTVEFADDKTYFWDLKTNKGKIRIKFLHKVAPNHVANYLYLTELGFFDGLSFHRVISGFMAQGGDPLGNGRGGPGYKFSGEYDRNTLHDKPGILSMANAGPGTDGSQFFITFLPTPHLDGKHTVFGEVVEGLDTVKVLEAAGSRNGAPSEPLSIETAKITVE
ncbi:MAG: peptidyl-prolyl cis-trans isomerase B (cyclophilin B) [Kiritimatiellia bacterium]|jgi:peptidyl-prolyl cis-trans isomerase B (cyclophilin B)